MAPSSERADTNLLGMTTLLFPWTYGAVDHPSVSSCSRGLASCRNDKSAGYVAINRTGYCAFFDYVPTRLCVQLPLQVMEDLVARQHLREARIRLAIRADCFEELTVLQLDAIH